MAGLAYLLKQAGHDVSGCDLYATDRTRWLEANGIPVARGHSPSHVTADLDEFIVTPAVPKDNPEFAAARAASVRVRYRGEVLAEVVNAADGIAVCGTHGKTTTSTFTTRLLRNLGDSPSWCIGGETGAMAVAGTGTGPLVVEADESDGTLALYHPQTLVLNAVDFDHLEHFASKEAYFDCYRTVVRGTVRTVIVCHDHPQALVLARAACPPNTKLVTFGFDDDADVRAADWPDIPVLGRHNVLNALAAIAVALSRGHARDAILAALPDAVAALPARRFDVVHPAGHIDFASYDCAKGVTVITDYAHHPAELKCAIDMARALRPTRLRVVFQPHRYSRTKALLDEFPPAFANADEVVLVPVYAAFEQPIPGGDIADLYAAFRATSPRPVLLARAPEEAWKHLFLTARPGDVLMILGAGDIIGLIPRVKSDMPNADFAPRAFTPLAPHSFFRTGGVTCGGGTPVAVGMGSNTWFSDCATDIDLRLVKGTGDLDGFDVPAGLVGATLLPRFPALAFMAGIPGTVGGWTKMNAGAFGHAFGEFVERVTLEDGTVLSAAACGFAYRHTDIDGIIASVTLTHAALTPDANTPEDYVARRKKFPPRTCGSVFKNPPEAPAGRLLEEAGCKGLRVGGAAVWSEHANVIVAGDGCTSSDILALARLMAARVREKFHIVLHPEVHGLVV